MVHFVHFHLCTLQAWRNEIDNHVLFSKSRPVLFRHQLDKAVTKSLTLILLIVIYRNSPNSTWSVFYNIKIRQKNSNSVQSIYLFKHLNIKLHIYKLERYFQIIPTVFRFFTSRKICKNISEQQYQSELFLTASNSEN